MKEPNDEWSEPIKLAMDVPEGNSYEWQYYLLAPESIIDFYIRMSEQNTKQGTQKANEKRHLSSASVKVH